MAENTAKATAGQRAAVIAGVLGLVPALVLGLMRLMNQETPEVREQLLGNLAFVLVLASPYLLALVVSRFSNPAARGALLLALATLSLVASFIALSGATLMLLPGTVALFAAAVISLWGAGRLAVWAPLFLVPGMLSAAAIGFSFYALFQMQEDQPRCWVIVEMDGQEEWYSLAVPPPGEPGTMTMGPSGPETRRPGSDSGRPYRRTTEMGPFGSGVRKTLCLSDIITNEEAAFGLLGVGAGFLFPLLMFWAPLAGRWMTRQRLWNSV